MWMLIVILFVFLVMQAYRIDAVERDISDLRVKEALRERDKKPQSMENRDQSAFCGGDWARD
jgi:hypothetical protein